MQKTILNKNNIPEHVAIIMDGNGRWAKKQGQKRIFGHKNGVNAVREAVEAAAEVGVKHLTLYAFSTENWNRPKFEINALMSLFISAIKSEEKKLIQNNVKLTAIGNLNSLPSTVQKKLNKIIQNTSKNTGLNLNLALSYSSRQEITEMVKTISKQLLLGKIKETEITEDYISHNLQTKHIPDPELLIRTSGEHRISNFLLWQISYSEFYFTETLWPDFTKKHFFEAILNYQNRERRFGKTGDQIEIK